MVKITVSFTERRELKRILQILKPFTLKSKVSENPKGVYKKAYLELDI